MADTDEVRRLIGIIYNTAIDARRDRVNTHKKVLEESADLGGAETKTPSNYDRGLHCPKRRASNRTGAERKRY
jgi:hypothetical protein